MAVNFQSGFPYQQGGQKTSIEDTYTKLTQIGLNEKARLDAQNLKDFEEEVGNLFRTASMPDGKIEKAPSGNFMWTGNKTLPDKKTAFANYKYLANKYDIDLDYATSAKFDEIYGGMMATYGQQLGAQLQNLTSSGVIDDNDIREAAMNPALSKVLNTLAVDGGQPAFNMYLPQATTAERLMKKASNLSFMGGAGALATAGATTYAAGQYGPAMGDYLFGSENEVLKKGKSIYSPLQKGASLYGPRQMPMVPKFVGHGRTVVNTPANQAQFRDMVIKDVQKQNPKFKWSAKDAKLNKNGFRGWNSKEAFNAANKAKDKIAPKSIIGTQLKGGKNIGTDLKWETKKTPGKLSGKGLGGLRGMSWLFPTLAEQAAEGVFGEDTVASAVARTAGGGVAIASNIQPGYAALKRAANKGFGSFWAKKVGPTVAKKLAAGGTLAMLDGPLPIMDAIIAIAGVGYSIYEAYNIYQEWQNIKSQ